MRHKLEQGCVLVISGPRGSGKSTLAREIARSRGAFVEADSAMLEAPRGLEDLLLHGSQTVIVDGFPQTGRSIEQLKEVIALEDAVVAVKYAVPRKIRTPYFIFCTLSDSYLPDIATKFHVIRLNKK